MKEQIDINAPQPSEREYDAIIIGSGMSGLVSGVVLAKEGMRVLMLEKHYRIGGYLHRFFRKGGIAFDVGFHYLGGIERDQVLGMYLNYCGVLDRIKLLPLDPEGYDEMRFPDCEFTIPAGEERYRTRLIERFPQERNGIEKYFRDLRSICDGFALFRVRTEQDFAHGDRWMSQPLGPYLDGLVQNERLKAILSGQNALYGVEPTRTPVGLHALVTDSFVQGPYGIQGGGDALAQQMGKRLKELGGKLKTRRTVTQIMVDDNRRARGVRTHRGEEFRAPLIISCAHPKITIQLLPRDVLRPGYRKRVLGMEDGTSNISVFATTKLDLAHYASRNIYSYKTFDIDSIYRDLPPPYRFGFVSVPTAREGRTKGGLHQVVVLSVMPYPAVEKWADTTTGERGEEYEAFKHRHAEEIMEVIYEVLPELRGNVESLEAATPLTNRDYASSIKGASYGIHHSVEQSGRYGLRPRTRVFGLYLTGQSVLMPGVCGTTISAFHTCSYILGTENLIGKVHAAA